jgi:hypothetical protein
MFGIESALQIETAAMLCGRNSFAKSAAILSAPAFCERKPLVLQEKPISAWISDFLKKSEIDPQVCPARDVTRIVGDMDYRGTAGSRRSF